MQKTNLQLFTNSWYNPGRNYLVRSVWFVVSALFFLSGFPINSFKIFLLRLFGARIGKMVVVKPGVNIKYPWKLSIGDNSWLGERVWIDNLTNVTIEANCCISQGAMLLTGNHNYKKQTFDLIVGEIVLEEGVWIGAQSVVCPGVVCGSHAVLTVGSVATKTMEPYFVYQGNPAIQVKKREIN
ncbi:MAG: WcaF family extracellular polysaccharide biosynthesis acetyltransferase [Bacteroidetes bacterium]|nr:WcaF family extracellular polysaccharide biosynthesis acetyltransferase [Bacteroidota bacterium]